MSNIDKYPHKVYASVILLDDKIYKWKIGMNYWESAGQATLFIRSWDDFKRMESKYIAFEVNNPDEHEEAFSTKAPEWFAQWEAHEDIMGAPPRRPNTNDNDIKLEEFKDRLEDLNKLIVEMESACHGGFRISTDEEDVALLKWVVKNLQKPTKEGW